MLPQKIVITLKKFLHLNIVTLRKCITLKYLIIINHYSYSIKTHALLIKILMTFNISWVALKKLWYNSNKWNKNHKTSIFINNLNLNNYSFEFTPTETSAGGTLLYIANHLSYKCHNDLKIYKKNELESTFIEIVNP